MCGTPDLTEEDIDDDTPEDEHEIILTGNMSAWAERGFTMGRSGKGTHKLARRP